MEWLRVLQTFGSAGAGTRWKGCAFYKHSPPPEPGRDGRAARSTNIRLRWSRDEMEGLRVLQTFATAGAGTRWKGCAFYKHSAPLEPGRDGRAARSTNIRLRWSRDEMEGLRVLQTFATAGAGTRWKGCAFYKHSAPLEPGRDGRAARSTNIRLRWSRDEMEGLRVLQTFATAGAGTRWKGCAFYKHSAPLEPGRDGRAARSTNIRLRWSRDEMEGLRVLQTFATAGAGTRWKGCAFYKHSAPLEPGRDGRAARSTNIRLRWSRDEMEGLRVLQTFATAGAGTRWKGCAFYKHSAPLEPGRDGRAARSTNIRLRWSRDEMEGLRVLQTFATAGAGTRWKGCAFYKHSAPPEPGRDGMAAPSTNIRLRWSRDEMEGLRVLQTLGSAGAGT